MAQLVDDLDEGAVGQNLPVVGQTVEHRVETGQGDEGRVPALPSAPEDEGEDGDGQVLGDDRDADLARCGSLRLQAREERVGVALLAAGKERGLDARFPVHAAGNVDAPAQARRQILHADPQRAPDRNETDGLRNLRTAARCHRPVSSTRTA